MFILIPSCFFCATYAAEDSSRKRHVGSREGDPASLVENVSTIHGDYSEYEIDLIVPGPDSLILSRSYNSRDSLLARSTFGGWRFNPHCFLFVEKTTPPKSYTTADGTFDYTRILVGTNEGSILTFVGWQNTTNRDSRSQFKIDIEGDLLGMANTARGNINAWSNLKNNQLYFNAKENHFEVFLSSGGKRLYAPSSSALDLYLLKVETLPSGNKIFYEYEGDVICRIKMTNATEEKILSWIAIQYGSVVHAETSDQKAADYHFHRDLPLLSEVVRSHKPSLKYEYRIADGFPFLVKKELPEGRFVQIDYYLDGVNQNKVESVTTPTGKNETTTTRFSYSMGGDGSGYTEVNGPKTCKAIYRYDDQFRLTAIEQFLNGELYRTHKKIWGMKKDAGNLIGTSIEDRKGLVHYFKSIVYDDKNNILEEKEYGNLTGAHPETIVLDEEGIPQSNHEFHTKTYSYRTIKDEDVVTQKDDKGSSVKLCYKKGTDILVKKFIFENKHITNRWFYNYDQDGALVRVVSDDGDEENEAAIYVRERHITVITPKKELPNSGAPEIVEEKYLDTKKDQEIVLKKKLFGFDSEGNINSIAVYDANGEHRYTQTFVYERGLLKSESSPIGDESIYSYDGNQNLISIVHSNSNLSVEYQYDLKNRLIYLGERDSKGNCLKTTYAYDAAGNITSEIDRQGNETVYESDDLGRIVSKTYPALKLDEHQSAHPIYRYEYDLFDHVIRITDPEKEVIQKAYTVRGTPTLIRYPDGTQELFKYDPEGSLHRHLGKDGIIKVFEYDYQGRLAHIEYYERGSKGKKDGFKREFYGYDAFHLTSHVDEGGNKTTYTYDKAGRLAAQTLEEQKIEFVYDSLGRNHGIKKWKSAKTFTLEIKEHDLLDRIIEERIEDAQGKILLKTCRIYNEAGSLQKIISYPQNQESVLAQYDYDEFGRVCEIKDAFGTVTKVEYEDQYVNEWGQKVLKRTQTDPYGTEDETFFDPAGRIAKILKKDSRGKLLAESAFFFDLNGHLNFERSAVTSQEGALRNYCVRMSYSGGKFNSWTLAAGTQDEITSTWKYDAYGNPLAHFKPGIADPITYQYNDKGQIGSIGYKNENQEITHKLIHDEKGNLREVEFGKSRSITYKINPNNLLSSETVKDEFGSYQVKISYDGEGCIETIQLPDDSLIKYTYEGPFVKSVSRQLKEKKELYNYRIVSRDLMGHILEEVLVGHTGARKQTWDKGGRRTGIFTDFFSDQVIDAGYDLLHNIKKRTISIDGKVDNVEYGYNALNEIIFEKGAREHIYCYDSLGNRLKQDNSSYLINHLNQVIDTGREVFTYDLMGHLETKTVADKTWQFKTNPFGDLISIQDPNQTILTFTYDLAGKRLSKKVDAKGKKAKTNRYFYLGETELGCLDEKGNVVELKIPGDPNNPEALPCIAVEINGETYAPLYDLQGNIVCLVDPDMREVKESYSYSAFGSEEIFNQRGKLIPASALSNPWRYKGKRVDSETGLVYFGKRYYDPTLGRWLSPDPMGSVDSPNLYLFCQNNPLTYNDYLGLSSEKNGDEFANYFYGEYEPHCHCERHRDCKRGGDIGNNRLGGIAIGISNYYMKTAEFFFQTPLAFSLIPGLKTGYEGIVQSNLNLFHEMWDEGLGNLIDFDPLNEQTIRYKNATGMALTALDIYRGNIKDIRKGLSFFKKTGPHEIQIAVRSRVQLPNGRIAEGLVDLSPTIERIQKGIKFPHRNDGTVFKNREGLLPKRHSSYYREYVHPTPGIEGPGPQRIIVGENGELFYSPDHYQTFIQVK
ncbi:MAG: hypothetical protein K1X28_09485 [Parachlamydiales bacterium]|nr:hypothetical protein [Parachlamydiales bacterium]